MTVLACGEALWDLFAVEGPDGLSFEARPGGSPLNVALGLVRLGEPVELLAGISTDPLGERLMAVLGKEGVGTRYLQRSSRPSSLSLIDLDVDGQPAYSIHGEGCADRELADVPELEPDVEAILLSSFALVAEPVGSRLLALARREAGRRLVVWDPNVRLMVVPDLALWQGQAAEMAGLADVIKASGEDIAALYPGEAPGGVAARWLAAGAGLVVITKGAEGAEAFTTDGPVTVPAPAIAVADTVGAGDSFMAALLAGLAAEGVRSRLALMSLGRARLLVALRFAAAAAAVTCTRRGADPPTRGEVTAEAERF